MEEVLSLMESAEQWLEGIKKGLLSVSSARKRWVTGPQPKEDVVALPPVPLQSALMMAQPQKRYFDPINNIIIASQ